MRDETVRDILYVLKGAYRAVKRENYGVLDSLSNQLNHSITVYQEKRFSECAVAVFALSKIFEKEKYLSHPTFQAFRGHIISLLRKSIHAVKRAQPEEYMLAILEMQKIASEFDAKIGTYSEPLVEYAKARKASSAVEHGLSVERASELFEIPIWSISKQVGTGTSIAVQYTSPSQNQSRMELAKRLFKV